MSSSGYYKGILTGDKYVGADWLDDEWENYYDTCRKPVLEEREKKAECDHEWEVYMGLSETFEFCTKCDIKKEDEE